MSLARREKRIVWMGAAVAGGVILFNWVLAPLWSRWTELDAELQPRLQKLDQLRNHADRWQATLARRARLIRQIGGLSPWQIQSTEPEGEESGASTPTVAEGAVPGADRLEAALEELMKKNGAQVKLLSSARPPSDALKGTYFRPVAVRVEIDTDTMNLFKLLHALEGCGRYFRVQSLKIHYDGKRPNKLSVSAEIVGYELNQLGRG